MTLVDRVAGMLAILGGALLFITGWGLDIGDSKLPGAGFFPVLIALAMAGIGIRLTLRPGAEKRTAAAEPPRWRSLAVGISSVVVYALVMTELGYLLSTFALLAVHLRWVEDRTWRTSLSIAVLGSVVSLVLFRVALKVPLPLGVLPLPTGW
ncbi:MAG TPA: tripartite tricarboxylate transporter TctB family protein [Thermodesulfobacteriota bacterium]|nr:tripartite tricarboxylate transporter TctB family protein [Thermodesulfobacteriota bacterium]